MKRSVNLSLVIWIMLGFAILFLTNHPTELSQAKNIPQKKVLSEPVRIETPPATYELPQSQFVAQSFNNCGPASLSMVMSMFGKQVSQEELAKQMRPFNNPYGGVDDKSIFFDEFVTYAKKYEFNALFRPNGNINLLKKFVSNGIPVVVRTWLHPGEDIGHFRIVRGYDENQKMILQDDSYQGPNLQYSYDEFMSMWQPFNYSYILVYPKEKQEIINAILDSEIDEKTAWKHAIDRAHKEIEISSKPHPDPFLKGEGISAVNAYAEFNLSSAYYYLGNYTKSIQAYEKAAPFLPSRMLWYQIEPLYSYLKLGNYDTVFQLTDSILYNGNLAYSELYQMRGEAYLARGEKEWAREEFEKAVYYNTNYKPAKEALENF